MIEKNEQVRFEFLDVSLEDTLGFIHKLKNKNSSGHDEISPILIKACANQLAPYIQMLIN